MELPGDVYEHMTNFADDRSIMNMLSVNRKFHDPAFFQRVMQRKYPLLIEFKKPNENWREFFIRMVYAISKLEEETKIPYIPTKGFDPDELFQRYRKLEPRYKLPKFNGIYNELAGVAAEGGHLDLLNLVIEKNPHSGLYNWAMVKAARGGHLNMVKYLIEKGANDRFEEAVKEAAGSDHFELMKYILSKFEFTRHNLNIAMNYAGQNGHLQIVKYLVDKGARDFSSALDYAAGGGHMAIVKYLVDKGAHDIRFAINVAKNHGHIEIANYLTEIANKTGRY